MGKPKDIIGQKFNKLTILELHHKKQVYCKNKKNGFKYYYLCKCECGNETIVSKNHLLNNHTKSCGKCIYHNKSDSRLYRIYQGIKQRCYNPNRLKYKNYGARNITMCDEWLNDFMSFYNWAINNGYKDNLTIDRIDNNKGYCPENCRWITQKEQQNNRTNNHLITYNNETHTIRQWSELLKINYNTLQSRIKYGWSVEKSFITRIKDYS